MERRGENGNDQSKEQAVGRIGKGLSLLEGVRGQEPVDISSLEDLLLKVSRFVKENPQIQELDLNPVFAYHGGTVAVDARIVLSNSPSSRDAKEKR